MRIGKLITVLVAIGCLVGGGVATANAGSSAFIGLSSPLGDLGDDASMGYHLGGAMTFPVAPTMSIGGRVAYNHFGLDNNVDGGFNMIEALAIGQLSVPMGPGGIIGVGLTSSKAEIGPLDFDRETDLTYVIGGSYSMTLLKVTLLYHSISTEGDATNYFTASVGLGF